MNVRRLGVIRDVSHRLERWPVAADVVVVAAGVVAFVVIASTIGYVLAFWRFRLTRHNGGTLQVTRGLITTRATSIEQRRLRGVEVSEPLLLRSVRGARCLAIATGLRVGRGAERGGEILLPPAPRADAVALAATRDRHGRAVHEALVRHPIAALRRRLTRALSATLVLVCRRGPRRRVRALAGVVARRRGRTGRRGRPARHRSLPQSWPCAHRANTSSPGTGRSCGAAARCRPTGVIGWNIRRSFFQRRVGIGITDRDHRGRTSAVQDHRHQ